MRVSIAASRSAGISVTPPGMMEVQIFDDHRRLGDQPAVIDDDRKLLERPQRQKIGLHRLAAIQQPVNERRGISYSAMSPFWQ